MQWNRSNTIGIAKMSCSRCHGNGTRLVRYGHEAACNCAYRAAFRTCLNRFRECSEQGAHASTVSLDIVHGPRGKCVFSRKCEEYAADFCLVSRRVLDEFHYKIFRYHFVFGADWRLCCRQLQIDRGTFFHAVYRIEQILGRTFAELEPYPLYPPEEYFGGAPYDGELPRDPLPALLPKAA
jgi:hypothetical protein